MALVDRTTDIPKKVADRGQQPRRELPVTAYADDNFALCMEWLSGEDEKTGLEFSVTTGAGLGSPMLRLTVEKGDTRRVESIDIRDLTKAWVKAVVGEIDAGTLAPVVWVNADTGEAVEPPKGR